MRHRPDDGSAANEQLSSFDHAGTDRDQLPVPTSFLSETELAYDRHQLENPSPNILARHGRDAGAADSRSHGPSVAHVVARGGGGVECEKSRAAAGPHGVYLFSKRRMGKELVPN